MALGIGGAFSKRNDARRDRVKTRRYRVFTPEPSTGTVVTNIGYVNWNPARSTGPVRTPPPAILGRTQLEAVCHDFNQKLLPPD